MSMKSLRRTCCIGIMLVMVNCRPPATLAGAAPPDSLSRRSANALVMNMARLIKQYAYFHGGTAVFRYDAWVDTTNGLKLYIAEQVAVLGDRADPDWYYIDFTKPIKSDELTVLMGRNDNFVLDASKKITKRAQRMRPSGRIQREKHKALPIFFFTNKKKRTTDFGKLHDQLATIIRQLILQTPLYTPTPFFPHSPGDMPNSLPKARIK